jgi:two-component system response regulator AtoC
MKKILIVDDSRSVRESLRIIFKDSLSLTAVMGKLILITADFKEDLISLTGKEKIDLIIWGVSGPWNQRLDILQSLVNANQRVALLIMGEQQVLKEFQRIFDYGIINFIEKPFNVYEIRKKVKSLLIQKDLPPSFSQLSFERKKADKYLRLPYSSIFGEKVAPIIKKAINTNVPVLIKGEKGTGKELLAKLIHYHQGLIKGKGFFKVDCTNLAEESWIRIFQRAKDTSQPYDFGTLFLEEIGDLRPEFQMSLIEIMDEEMILLSNEGGSNLDFRIIASTSVDLLKKVSEGGFRQDLFYKLHVMPIYLFPLREKREEIPLLVNQFIVQYGQKMRIEEKEFSSEAMRSLQNYFWPGNLRELECVVTRSAIFSKKQIISKEEILWAFEEKDLMIFTEDKDASKETLLPSKEVDLVEFKAQSESVFEDNLSFEALLTSFAHEIKNPLVAIKTFTQLLKGKFDDPEFRGQFYQIVGDNVDQLNNFTEEILRYYQFTSAVPNFSSVDIYSLIEMVLKEGEDKLKTCSINVKKEFVHNMPKIFTDKDQISFALRNILSNTVKMLPEEETIHFFVDIVNFEEDDHPFINPGTVKGKAAEIKISYPGLKDLKDKRIKTDVPSSSLSTPILGLELFMAQKIIDKNLGVMEIKNTKEKEIIIIIKVPINLEG